ncbi:hypothetical protein [Amycolatopsis alkalitolerans]|uniref:Uncharacterized protein n=1 Tax=Amycolatopsis alkalitolerans TaxID=2547244 RepID=A0A5C4M095_9PSEU|nr:hypothetical protein [Amycolatopsis alkalitolerans]TNC24870.1 hypothetical protein FG385_16640 [Amycolatopsis alkalitolerans]
MNTKVRPSTRSRRAGYVIAIVLGGALAYLINVAPGWEVLPFLTPETSAVLPLVNASILVGIALNLIWLFIDPPWFTALGGLATTGLGLAALVRFWQVFPVAFAAGSFNWAMLIRIGLVVGIVGSAIGLLVNFGSLLRALPGVKSSR